VEFWIDLVLTLLGYLPGIIYAIYYSASFSVLVLSNENLRQPSGYNPTFTLDNLKSKRKS
ncbi:hypothetical protein S245_072014, partial [Arachis hypogaea]